MQQPPVPPPAPTREPQRRPEWAEVARWAQQQQLLSAIEPGSEITISNADTSTTLEVTVATIGTDGMLEARIAGDHLCQRFSLDCWDIEEIR